MSFTTVSAHFPSPKHWFVNEEVSWWNVTLVSETLCMTLCVFFFYRFCRHDTTRRSEVLTRKPSGRQQAKQEGMIERHCYQWRLLLGKWMLHHSHIWIGCLCLVALQLCAYIWTDICSEGSTVWVYIFRLSSCYVSPVALDLTIKCNERYSVPLGYRETDEFWNYFECKSIGTVVRMFHADCSNTKKVNC